MILLNKMRRVTIEVISKDRKKIYLPLQYIKVFQTQTFRNIFNGLASIALMASTLSLDDTSSLRCYNTCLISDTLNFVCVLVVRFKVFTTYARLRNLIWMLIRIPFATRLAWIDLKHIITLFIRKYMKQWAEKSLGGVGGGGLVIFYANLVIF